jgi:putative membrane protein
MTEVSTAGDASSGIEHVRSVLPDATRLAVHRTRLALERTLMAWVRTATSLITFGFAVYKFFQFEKGDGAATDFRMGHREFALMMISIGIFSLLLATFQHRQSMKMLRAHSQDMHLPVSLATIVGGFISLLGVLALIAVILRS